uniref:Uncharacterized protein n=1 Tax=Plectus sambesii TaxID=2011161 RepID=A0A914WPV3_9BILA
MYNSNNVQFSTIDSRNSADPICYYTFWFGGWWLTGRGCAAGVLNGKYNPSPWGLGYRWRVADWINPKQSRMMLRSMP